MMKTVQLLNHKGTVYKTAEIEGKGRHYPDPDLIKRNSEYFVKREEGVYHMVHLHDVSDQT